MSDDPQTTHVHSEVEERDGALVVHKRALDPSGAALIRREVDVLSHLRHPNVVELVDHTDGDQVGLWTSFVGRSTLADVTPTDAAAVARIATTLVTCLLELHEMGWCHANLNGAHVVVGADGRLTLCSFGAARRTTDDAAEALRNDLGAAGTLLGQLLDRTEPSHRRVEQQRRSTVTSCCTLLTSRGTRAAAKRCIELLSNIAGAVPTPHRTRPSATQSSAKRPPATPPFAPARARSRILAVVALAGVFALAALAVWRLGGPLHAPWQLAARHSATFGDLPAPVAMALDAARLFALAACGYGAILCVTAAAMSIRHRDRLDDVLARVAPPLARKVMVGAIGVGMISSVATRPSHGAMRPTRTDRSPVAVAVVDTPTTDVNASTTSASTPISTTSTISPMTTTSTSMPSTSLLEVASPEATTTEPSDAAVASHTWTIAPGDHLWRVAATTLEVHLGRRPTTAEIDVYWRAVVEHNRARLADPTNPDLVFTGQVIDLPPMS